MNVSITTHVDVLLNIYLCNHPYHYSFSEHQYKNGNWPLEDLDATSADIAAGATYSEATEGQQISRATLHSR